MHVMKSIIVKYILVLFIIALGTTSEKTYSQVDIMGRLLTGGIDDAEKVSEAYLNPFIDAFSANLNSGWYTTAKPHSLFGFDITVSFNTAIVPSSAKSYDLALLGLSGTIEPVGGGTTIAPTFSHSQTNDRPSLVYYEEFMGEQVELTRFRVPNGTGVGYIPAPMMQAGIGLPFDTDIIVRYLPDMTIGSTGRIGLYGFGIKHSIKQWIPVIEKLPLINLSLMAGYTNFGTSSGIDLKPVDVEAEDLTTDNVNFSDQSFNLDVNSYTVNLIGSVDIPFFVAYGAVGFTSNTANLKMKGYYPIPTLDPADGAVIVTDESVVRKDPVDITVQGDANKYVPRYNFGVTFKFGVLHLNIDYTYAYYSVASVGLALSVR